MSCKEEIIRNKNYLTNRSKQVVLDDNVKQQKAEAQCRAVEDTKLAGIFKTLSEDDI